VKRIFDVLFAALGLVFLSPFLLGIALFIKIVSPGPIFYRGVRTGQYGVPFRIFKFRTMVVDAELKGGVHTAKNDPRVFRGAYLLRRYKLDELPQLLNVLKGDMSIVGPRPEVELYTKQYSPAERAILDVKPGITDYASIEFVSLGDIIGDEDPYGVFEREVFPRKTSLRLKYVREHTILVDFKIICMTVYHILRKVLR
jgi:lipopolysaccharide/colanic/teichoic acid biosynthesis glycosyltransferase